jgi:hypothetical protein
MMKRILLIALACLAAGTASADVSNEIVLGLEGDSSKEVTIDAGGTTADVSDRVENKNVLFGVAYTRFFEPLKDDGTHIDLRRFLQHPSTISVGLAFRGTADKDARNPLLTDENSTISSMLTLGGELYVSTGTGFLLTLGGGSGTHKDKINGVTQPETDVTVGMFRLGVRQYVTPNAEIHLSLNSESSESTPPGAATITTDRNVLLLGAQGVIRNMVGLLFELGGGSKEVKSTLKTEYDVAEVNAEIALYAVPQWTFRLALELAAEEQENAPSGFSHKHTTVRTTLAARYWFSERIGFELPLYATTTEDTTGTPLGETKTTGENSGAGLYATLRF